MPTASRNRDAAFSRTGNISRCAAVQPQRNPPRPAPSPLPSNTRVAGTSRAYAKVKLARCVDQSLLDAYGESVLSAAIALTEARRGGAVTERDRSTLERVEIDGAKRPLRELTVAVLRAELERVRGRARRESTALVRLRAAIERDSALSGTIVRARNGKLSITAVPEARLPALAAALAAATRG